MWSYIGNVFLIVFFLVTYSARNIQKLEEKYVLVAQSFSVLHDRGAGTGGAEGAAAPPVFFCGQL